jgi:hypothetical protein
MQILLALIMSTKEPSTHKVGQISLNMKAPTGESHEQSIPQFSTDGSLEQRTFQ